MEISPQTTIGEIVAHDFRTAAVFSKKGIDFCCKGHRTLEEISDKKSLNIAVLSSELTAIINQTGGSSIDFKSWPMDLLADYIEKTHHRYIEEKTPIILLFLSKLCKVHGERHPELFEINELFQASAQDLAAHLKKEELILFPFIRKMVTARLSNQPLDKPHFGTVDNPIEMMKHEHDSEGERFREIARLTDNYTAPSDGCTTYRTAFMMLEEFEQDLHKHIHLENNILFPNAQALEKTFN